jgi:hypothetical protein
MNMLPFITKAPQVGLEPTTNRLTVDSSTTELLRICLSIYYIQIYDINISHINV